VFANLKAVTEAAGGSLDDVVKLSVLLADLGDFAKVNEIMASYFKPPYPARATYQVAGLPRGARIEVEGIVVVK
jgi:reactive intermediate/imine deaminase